MIFFQETKENFFWNPKFNFEWKMNHEKWLEYIKDLPNPKINIEFLDEKNLSWLVLTSLPRMERASK